MIVCAANVCATAKHAKQIDALLFYYRMNSHEHVLRGQSHQAARAATKPHSFVVGRRFQFMALEVKFRLGLFNVYRLNRPIARKHRCSALNAFTPVLWTSALNQVVWKSRIEIVSYRNVSH